MDDDEFDGDIADEDLMLALETASSVQPAPATSSTFSPASRQPAHRGPVSARRPEPSLPPARSIPVQNCSMKPPPARAHVSQSHRMTNDRTTPYQSTPDHTLADSLAAELDGLPSDAFDSSQVHLQSSNATSQRHRQTTLFGDTVQDEPASLSSSNRVYRGDLPPERPTHHKLDRTQLQTWVYPTNLGPIRDYQFSIVKSGLFHNTLVALPTGLGKTFIAATVILNFYRWTTEAKMVFVAPTKPLVSQQVDACLNVAGIPRSETTLLTGDTPPALRAAEWKSKRLFFMTPQTLQNDLSKGYAPPKSIVLLVIDEAHRSTGDYAYVKVISALRRYNTSFRVLALTATPGSKVESVQDVIDNLGVSHVEIRTEESIDIRQYVHNRGLERFVLDPSVEIRQVQEYMTRALQPFCEKLDQQKIWYGRDAMSLTAFGLMKVRTEWVNGPGRNMNQGVKGMILAVFSVLQGVAHAIKLLNFHGIRPFYDNMDEFRRATLKDEKGSKYRRQLVNSEDFREMMDTIDRWLHEDSFESHPKIGYLRERLCTHFLDNQPSASSSGTPSTRAIVFSEFRDSADEIVRTLNQCGAAVGIKASVFVGQADSKRSAGMKQKEQIETIEQFKAGKFNVLVATSIGEEGLDIGQVDLIICYDASASPIRMLQRMGRTGRKRAGHVLLLLMRGKEEEKFAEAQNAYAHMQKLICDGSHFNYRFDMSERILPRDIKPEVEKRHVEIPIENTQDRSLPEPRRANARALKAPKKTFHMLDNVETGFVRASDVRESGDQPNDNSTAMDKWVTTKSAKSKSKTAVAVPPEIEFLVNIPDMEAIATTYGTKSKHYKASFDPIRLAAAAAATKPAVLDTAKSDGMHGLGPTGRLLPHGQYTRRLVHLMERMKKETEFVPRTTRAATAKKKYKKIPVPSFVRDPGAEESEPEKNDKNDKTSKSKTVKKTTTKAASVKPSRPSPSPSPSIFSSQTMEEQQPEAKRRRVFAPPVKLTQRQRIVASYSGFSSSRALKKEESEEEEDDEEGDGSQRWRPKKSFKPAVKGQTKQRSSQWQSYNFSGGLSSTPNANAVNRATPRPTRDFTDSEEENEREAEQRKREEASEREAQKRREEAKRREEERREEERRAQEQREAEERKREEEKRRMEERREQRKRQEREEQERLAELAEMEDEEMRAAQEAEAAMRRMREEQERLDAFGGGLPVRHTYHDEEENVIQLSGTRRNHKPVRARGARGGRGGARGAKSGASKGRGASHASYGRLEERGDDCMRTSDNYESDGSDSGGDLVDFIADDDEEPEVVTSSSRPGWDDDEEDTRRGGRRLTAKKARGTAKGKRAKPQTIFSSSPLNSSPPPRMMDIVEEDEDDETDNSRGNRGRGGEEEDVGSSLLERGPVAATRHRRLMMDSDSDE